MDELWLCAELLLLLGAANGSPIVVKRLLGRRWCAPLDGGLAFLDGRPLFGPSKTVRGVVAALVATALAAAVLGLPAALGAIVGLAAMAGDLLSSFIKRRLGVAPSGKMTGLDQIPEALLPLLAVRQALDLSPLQIIVTTLLFFLLGIPVAKLCYRLGLRDVPH